jgi:hypothetical protein
MYSGPRQQVEINGHLHAPVAAPSERERTVPIGDEFVWTYLDVTRKEKSLPLQRIE